MSQTEFDLSKRLNDLTEGFLGRGWLVDRVDDFVQGNTDRYLVLIGEAGIGKSAFCARLVQLGKVQAYHFCVAREGGTLDPIAFCRSMGRQLSTSLPGFGEHLVNQAPMKKIDVTQEIKELKGGTVYGVYIDKFIVQARSADEAFQILVREPLQSWAKEQPAAARVVLLVDALDEAARLDRHPNIADLVNSARDLPLQTRWVLTSRPDGPLSVLPGRREMILDQSGGNLEDVGAYVDATLGEAAVSAALIAAQTNSGDLRRELLARSRGNFLYLKYVLKDLRDAITAGLAPTPPERLPLGLDDVYREFLDRVLAPKDKGEWRRIYRPVLGVLAVAQESLEFEPLAALSKVKEQDVNDVVDDLRQFLDVPPAGEAGSYHIYHASFADFLTDRSRNPSYWIDPVQCHDQVVKYLLKRFGPSLVKCQAKLPLDRYALSHTAVHLAQAASLCQELQLADKQHKYTLGLSGLALSGAFQDHYEQQLGDLPALHRIVDQTVRRTAEDNHPEGLALAVEAALALVAFRRLCLTPDKIFTHAREGDIPGAEMQLNLFPVEAEWRQAALLHIAWLAAPKDAKAAEDLRGRVMANPNLVPPVIALAERVRWTLLGQEWPKVALPQVEEPRVRALLARLGGLKDLIGLPNEGGESVAMVDPEESSYAASIRMTDTDSYDLVCYQANHPEVTHNYVRDQLRILASNSYAQYRNRFLWPLFTAVLQHPKEAWIQDILTDILIAALSASPLEFEKGLPLTLLACRAASDPLARKAMDEEAARVADEAGPRRFEDSRGDSWGSYTRHLAALAQGYHLLHRQGIPGADQHMRDALALAGELHFGFAGFQTPAWLTLVETIRVCGEGSNQIRVILNSASDSAHNVQDPTFCARTTARFNAMRELWWSAPPAAYDPISVRAALRPEAAVLAHQVEPRGFPARAMAEAFARSPSDIPFTALHRTGETYVGRGGRGNPAPTPSWAWDARSLTALARLYGFAVASFKQLNPGLDPEAVLDSGSTPLVAVPDPEFAPLLAARCAAEILADPGLTDRDERVRLIQRLIPAAAANPTALDTVLARLLLAAYPIGPAQLDRLDAAVKGPHLATTGQAGAGGKMSGRDAGLSGTITVQQSIKPVPPGEMTGIQIDEL